MARETAVINGIAEALRRIEGLSVYPFMDLDEWQQKKFPFAGVLGIADTREIDTLEDSGVSSNRGRYEVVILIGAQKSKGKPGELREYLADLAEIAEYQLAGEILPALDTVYQVAYFSPASFVAYQPIAWADSNSKGCGVLTISVPYNCSVKNYG